MSNEINKRVTEYRVKKGLNQTEVAERMGMKYSTYSQMERYGNISGARIVALAEIFGISPDVLLCGEKPNSESEGEQVKENSGSGTFSQPSYNHPVDPFVVTQKEKNIITIIRNLPKKTQQEVIDFVLEKYNKS